MKALNQIIAADLYRYSGRVDLRTFFKIFFSVPGFRYSTVMRTTLWLKKNGIWFKPTYLLFRIWLNSLEYKFGISIPYNTEIGPGLYIGHFGGIVVNPKIKIDANCNLNHGVTIGETFGGQYPGVPSIGRSVYIGPHTIIIGGIRIGDHAAIGAGSVVTRSVQDHAVVAGNPAKFISDKGSSDYVVNTISFN